jgi:hypothetical protein
LTNDPCKTANSTPHILAMILTAPIGDFDILKKVCIEVSCIPYTDYGLAFS